jgi:hypothetical protein
MSFGAEIRARLGLDTSSFSNGLRVVEKDTQTISSKIGRIFEGQFGAGAIFRGLLQGLGIGSALSAIEKLSSVLSEASQHSSKLAAIMDSIGASARRAAEEISSIGASNEQVITKLEARLDGLIKKRAEMNAAPRENKFMAGLVERGSAADMIGGFSRRADESRAEQIAQVNKDVATVLVQLARARAATEEKVATDIAKSDQEREAAAERLRDFERGVALERMSAEERLLEMLREQRAVAGEILALREAEKAGITLTALGLSRLLDLRRRQADIEKQIKEDSATIAANKRLEEAVSGFFKPLDKQSAAGHKISPSDHLKDKWSAHDSAISARNDAITRGATERDKRLQHGSQYDVRASLSVPGSIGALDLSVPGSIGALELEKVVRDLGSVLDKQAASNGPGAGAQPKPALDNSALKSIAVSLEEISKQLTSTTIR